MNINSIEKAISEARRFLEAADSFKSALNGSNWMYGHPKESAALKRASMDLTRSLAEMRKPE